MAQYKDLFAIKHNDLRPSKGKILISEPFLQEVFFQRAVVLLVEHGSNGSMGFVVNKRTELALNDFFPEFGRLLQIPIYLGGPVSSNHLFFIHSLPENIPDGLQISENLYFDGNFESVKSYLLQGNPAEGNIKFFLGYSGWTENQLHNEIAHDSWLVSHSSNKSILTADDESYWVRVVKQLGSPYNAWTNYPKNPLMN
ncbi:MAG: YqgE/AlgH family protein [Tannerella sp.]|jgi:putative transcriptional regulator|nr:YqgE/AlgH family protein [Tannerella sp.]